MIIRLAEYLLAGKVKFERLCYTKVLPLEQQDAVNPSIDGSGAASLLLKLISQNTIVFNKLSS